MTDATYRQLIEVTFDAAGRASLAMSRTRFSARTQAREAVHAYQDLFAAIHSHLSYLTRPANALTSSGQPVASDPLLSRAESVIADRGRRQAAPVFLAELHPAAHAWRAAAAGLRGATDLLDTHRSPHHGWRTPDAALLDDPQITAAAITAIADLVRAVAGSGQVLALRVREVMPGNTDAAQFLNRAPLLVAAANLREYACNHARPAAIDGLQGARTVSPPTPADTPLGPAVAAVAQFRQQAWEHARQPDVSIRDLRAFAAAAVMIHEHVAAISAATAARWPELTAGRRDGSADILRTAAAASVHAARSWRQIHQQTQALHSPTPPTPTVCDQVAALGSALEAVTRSGGHWAPAAQLVPDLHAAAVLLEDVRQLSDPVPDIAGWHRRVAGVLATNRLLYAPATLMAREDVSDDPELVQARLARKLAPIPHRQAAALLADYRAAQQASQHSAHAQMDARAQVAAAAPAGRVSGFRGTSQQEMPDTNTAHLDELLRELAPAAAADPHAPMLLAALARAAAAGQNPETILNDIVADGPVPASHPARTLHYRLAGLSDAAITPAPTPQPDHTIRAEPQHQTPDRPHARAAPRR